MPRAEIEAFDIDRQLSMRGVWGLVKWNAQQVDVNDSTSEAFIPLF